MSTSTQPSTLREAATALADGAPSPRMPVLFVGHGNPMNALEDNEFSHEWRRIGTELPRPRAVICVSAHWMTPGTMMTAMPNPRTIHDFGGFPPELFAVEYPAPGDPALATSVAEEFREIKLDHAWGLDHGAWSVFVHMFPDADVPILQLSLDYNATPEQEFELAQTLRSLRDRSVLFIGSGNIVHNLRTARFHGGAPYDWAAEFDAQSRDLIESGNYRSLIDYERLGQAARLSVPTDEHYRPMLSILGLTHTDEHPVFFNNQIDLASISMRSFIMR